MDKSGLELMMAVAPTIADGAFEAWWRGLPDTLPQGSKAQMAMAFRAGMQEAASLIHDVKANRRNDAAR